MPQFVTTSHIAWTGLYRLYATSCHYKVVSREQAFTTLHNVCSVHRGNTMSTSGDTMSTSGGYHVHIGRIPWVHRGDIMSTSGDVQYIGVSINQRLYHLAPPHESWHPPMYWTSPMYSRFPLMYSWYLSDELNSTEHTLYRMFTRFSRLCWLEIREYEIWINEFHCVTLRIGLVLSDLRFIE